MPFVLEVTEKMKWKDLIAKAHMIIAKLDMKEESKLNYPSINGTPASNSQSGLGNSGIKVELVESGGASKFKNSEVKPEKKKYKIRVIRNDHHY